MDGVTVELPYCTRCLSPVGPKIMYSNVQYSTRIGLTDSCSACGFHISYSVSGHWSALSIVYCLDSRVTFGTGN